MKYLIPLLILLVTGCQKEIFSTGSDTESFPIFLEADVFEPEVGRSYIVEHRPSPTGDFFDNLGAIGTVSDGALGTTLFMGLFTQSDQDPVTQTVRFTVQFWPENFAAGRAASAAEMATFFAEGRTFDFGEGTDEVRLNLDLPTEDLSDELSSSAYLTNPDGVVTVEQVFPFQSSIPGLSDEERSALLVRLSFSGTIGVFDELDFLTAQADGIPYVAKKTAVVEGESVLVLASEWR